MPSSRPDQRGDSTFGNKIQLFEFDAGTNAKLWDIVVSGGVLTIRTRTDADAAGVDVLSVTRSGTALTIVALASAMVPAAADDAAAAALTPVVPIGGLYRTASALKIRVA
jgi:hypothetical protein